MLAFVVAPGSIGNGVNNGAVLQLYNSPGVPRMEAGVPVALVLTAGDGVLNGTVSGLTNGLGQITLSAWNIQRTGPTSNNLHVVMASAPGFASTTSSPFEVWAGWLDAPALLGGIVEHAGFVRARALGTYNGPLIRVRRASDATFQDFACAYGSDFVDSGAVDAFLATTTGVVTQVYDNTLNPNGNMSGGATSSPAYDATAFDGKPTVVFQGSPQRYSRAFRIPQPGVVAPYTVYELWDMADTGTGRVMWGASQESSTINFFYHGLDVSGFDRAVSRQNANIGTASSAINRSGAGHVYEARWVSDTLRSTCVDGDESIDVTLVGPPAGGVNWVGIGRLLTFAGASQFAEGGFAGWAEISGLLTSAQRNAYGAAFAADRNLTWTPLP